MTRRAKAATFIGLSEWRLSLNSVSRIEAWEAIGLGVALTSYLVVSLLLVDQGVPLGHDEAVYSARARELVRGEPASPWWGIYRSPGLPVILTLSWIGNGADPHLRLVVAFAGSTLIVFTWLLGRLMIGRLPAMVAALGLALTPVILTSATQVWPDVPGAAVGMVALYVHAHGLRHRRIPWWTVVIVPVLVGIATTIRYGAPIPLAIGLAGLTLWHWPAGWENRLRVAFTATGVAAIVYVLLMSTVLTEETPPIAALASLSLGIPVSKGFGDYWGLRGQLIAGSVVLGLLGIASALMGLVPDRELRKRFVWPFGIGLLTFLALSASLHGEARYLAPVYPWFWLASAVGLVALAMLIPWRLAVGLAVSAIVVCGFLVLQHAGDRNRFNEGFATLKRAASSLDTGTDCGVFTGYSPQVEWYSGCESVGIDRTSVVTDSPFLPEGPRYLFIVESGKRQPNADLLDLYLEETTGVVSRFVARPGEGGDIEIWTLADS